MNGRKGDERAVRFLLRNGVLALKAEGKTQAENIATLQAEVKTQVETIATLQAEIAGLKGNSISASVSNAITAGTTTVGIETTGIMTSTIVVARTMNEGTMIVG